MDRRERYTSHTRQSTRRVILADKRHPDLVAEIRRIVYEGSGPLLRALIQMLEEERVTVRVRRESRPEAEYRDGQGMTDNVIATVVATGAITGIKAGVERFRTRYGSRGRIRIEGEDDDQPRPRGRHRA
jgi:hypothetical protein